MSPGNLWDNNDGGFGYFSRNRANFHSTQYSDDPTRTVSWDPDMKSLDDDWRLFVFIPQLDNHQHRAAREIKYEVRFWLNIGGAGWQQESEFFTVDQSQRRGNQWFQMGGIGKKFETFRLSPGPKLHVLLTSARQSGDCQAANSCQDRQILADAILFMPNDCEP